MISTQNFPNCNKRFPQPSKEVANVKTTRNPLQMRNNKNATQTIKRKKGRGKTKIKTPPAPKIQTNQPTPPPKRKTPL